MTMTATYDGITYCTDDDSFKWHIENGKSEPYPRELQIVKNYLLKYPDRCQMFIDVGGHIGTTSLPYSRLYEHVIAFEPNKKSFDFFLKNIQLNNITNVVCFNQGVLDKKSMCKVVKHGDNSGCYYIRENLEEGAVEVIRLDDLDLSGHRIDFIKIDTEGSELFVLQGALEIIKRDHPLINVETNHCSQRYFKYNKEKIYELLYSMGYQILDDDGNNPIFF
jgi:FkbM family methyltransferase